MDVANHKRGPRPAQTGLNCFGDPSVLMEGKRGEQRLPLSCVTQLRSLLHIQHEMERNQVFLDAGSCYCNFQKDRENNFQHPGETIREKKKYFDRGIAFGAAHYAFTF